MAARMTCWRASGESGCASLELAPASSSAFWPATAQLPLSQSMSARSRLESGA
jgi:hypothetical protein